MKNLFFVCCALLLLSSCVGVENTSGPVSVGRPSQPTASGTVNFELYPNPSNILVLAGEEILFKLTPKVNNNSMTKVRVDFGDSSPAMVLELKRIKSGEAACQPLFVQHTFKKDGYYQVSVEGLGETSGSGNFLGNTQITIVPKLLTEEELKDKAIREMTAKLCEGLDVFIKNKKETPLTFSALKDANFEYAKDQLDVQVIQGMMKYLIEKEYKVLEKSPFALVRLAHESVFKVDPTNWKKKTEGKYQDYLEYGLTTQFNGPMKPFVYGAKIEGINDKFIASQDNSESTDIVKNLLQGKVGATKATDTRSTGGNYMKAYQNRPLLLAKFDTAKYLVVIDRIIDPVVDLSGPYYFSVKYGKKMIKRSAKVKINARILDQTGTIKWMKDIDGAATDMVVEEFAKTQNVNSKKSFF